MPSRRTVSFLITSILTVMVLALVAACSHPNREVPVAPPAEATTAASETNAAVEPVVQQPVAPPPATSPTADSAVAPETAPSAVAVPPPANPTESDVRTTQEIAKAPEPPPDPVKSMFEAEQRRADYEKNLANLAAQRDAAAAAVTQSEKDLLAFMNPYLPRPQLATESAEKIKDMDGAARADWARSKIDDAKAALVTAQKAYDDAAANPPN